MKFLNKLTWSALVLGLGLASCEKVDDLPFYENGTDPVAAASASTLAPTAADSLKDILTITWTDPGYASDPAKTKYLVQIDKAAGDFVEAPTRVVTGELSTVYKGKELNDILLSFGFEFGKPYDIKVRVVSSYGNNNEQRNSNVLPIKATPYKIPPKVAIPASGKLFIVGDATEGGWGNPVPTPTQEFTRIDETTFAGVFYLYGGAQYLVLPVNGSWDAKFSVANNTLPDLNKGGDFGANLNDNFPGPSADGLYKITLDFQAGKFKVEPFTSQHGLPSTLVVVGDATPQGWDNSVGNPYKFNRSNSAFFSLEVDLTAGKEYLILPEPGNWGKKYGVEDNNVDAAKLAGSLKPEGQNFKAPNTTGKYRIEVNFASNSYKLTKL